MAEKTQAQKKAQQKYMEKFAVARVRMARERYELVQSHAAAQGESVNGFINRAIDGAINPTPSEMVLRGHTNPPLAQGIVLPSDTLKAAGEASEATGEALESFVSRSVEEQVKRDQISWRMGVNPATGAKIRKGGTDHE